MPGNEWKVARAGSLLPDAERRTEDAEDSHVEMDGAIPVYRLHGSLNWSRVGDELKLFQDLRPAFRHGGDAAIGFNENEKSSFEFRAKAPFDAIQETDCRRPRGRDAGAGGGEEPERRRTGPPHVHGSLAGAPQAPGGLRVRRACQRGGAIVSRCQRQLKIPQFAPVEISPVPVRALCAESARRARRRRRRARAAALT